MSDESTIDVRMGDYQILAVLGAGGMGKVYKVRNTLSDRVEAMKVLLPNLAGQKDLANRFLQEIKVLAGFNHPNIAQLRTALTIENQLVMIMEYVPGTTLSARIERGPIPYEEALRHIDRVLDALSYAHHRQVIHRDIKPSNMMLTDDGVIKLMDFGIARVGPDASLTITGTTLGSLAYMSPEQVRCESVDARSDLYSVGVSLYEMVTGTRPFQADSNFLIMQAHLQETPKPPMEVRPGLPAAVNQIILMALEKDPARRFQSADAFRNALKGLLTNAAATGPTIVNAPSPLVPPARGSGRIVAPITLTPSPTGDLTGPLTAARKPPAAPDFAAAVPSTPTPVAPPRNVPPQTAKGHRGLYITLGALIVVAILAAASYFAPGLRKNQVEATPSPNAVVIPKATNLAANPPTTTTVAPTPTQPNLAGSAVSSPKGTPANKPAMDQTSAGPSDQNAAAGDASAQQPTPDPAQLADLDHEVDQLTSHEAAVNASVDNLKRQEEAQGLGLRGDMVAAQEAMKTYTAKAQAALQAQDISGTRKYLDLAEANTEKLEKFLGR
jgi:serine/threonine protein kinase